MSLSLHRTVSGLVSWFSPGESDPGESERKHTKREDIVSLYPDLGRYILFYFILLELSPGPVHIQREVLHRV